MTSAYIATFRFKWAPGPSPGFLVRWVNPGDWLAVMVKAADSKAWVYKRVNDGILQSPLSSGSTVSLTNGNWYTGKVVVGRVAWSSGPTDPRQANKAPRSRLTMFFAIQSSHMP